MRDCLLLAAVAALAITLTGCDVPLVGPSSDGDGNQTAAGGGVIVDVHVEQPGGCCSCGACHESQPTAPSTGGSALTFACVVTPSGSAVACQWSDGALHQLCLSEASSGFRACSPPVSSGFVFDAETNGPARVVVPTLEESGAVLATHGALNTTS